MDTKLTINQQYETIVVKGQQPPAMHQDISHQQVNGGGPSPLPRVGETHLECWAQSEVPERHAYSGVESSREP